MVRGARRGVFLASIGLAVLMAMPIGALLSPVGTAEAASLSTLTIGFMQQIDSLNPYIGISDASYLFYSLVYDMLSGVGGDLQPTPNLAEGTWAVPTTDSEMISLGAPYGSVWQYNLTHNAYWTDGEPLTADDVVWNMNLNALNYDLLWAYQPYSYYIDHAEKVDDYTVRVVFADRESGDLVPAAYAYDLSIPILPKHVLQYYTAYEIGFTWNGTPVIGSGPFMPTPLLMDEWYEGDHITLVKNPNYHAGADFGEYVQFDRLVLRFFIEPLAMYYALESGHIDVAQFPPQAFYSIKQDVESGTLQNVSVFGGPKINQYFTDVLINQNKAGPNPSRLDLTIRKAMALATNKSWICDNLYLGMAEPGSTLISPMDSYWHYEPSAGEKFNYDLSQAALLLESAGYVDTNDDGVRECTAASPAVAKGLVPEGTPLSYEMLVRREYPEERNIALYLKDTWAQIGISLTVMIVDEVQLASTVYSYSYDTAIWYWSGDIDPNYLLFAQTSRAIGGWSDIHYSNTSYDQNYNLSVESMNPAVRKGYVDDCQRIHYLDVGYIIMAYPNQTYAWRTDTFTGWGDWAAEPGRSIDNLWTMNPLWFDLVPGIGHPNTPPYGLGLDVLYQPATAGQGDIFVATAQDDDGDNLTFYIEYGDGGSDAMLLNGSGAYFYMAFFVHTYVAAGEYNVTLWVDDGNGTAGHNVSTVLNMTVVGPVEFIDYTWYDLFGPSFGEWWDVRHAVLGNMEPMTTEYPFIYRKSSPPLGNDEFYGMSRLAIDAENLTEVNMNENPEFLPYLGTERGGNATIFAYGQYMTSAEIADLIPSILSWNDGWIFRTQEIVLLDQDAAKSVLGIDDAGLADLENWWAVHNSSVSSDWNNWTQYEGNQRLDIFCAYDYSYTPLYFSLSASEIPDGVVVTVDMVSWGGEMLLARWLHDAFMPTEWFMENFSMIAGLGPTTSTVLVYTDVIDALSAHTSNQTGEPAWVFEPKLADYLTSLLHPSEFTPYASKTQLCNEVGNLYNGTYMPYDYTPAAWNLTSYETLNIVLPDSDVVFLKQNDTNYDVLTGPISFGTSWPSGADLPANVDIMGRTITFTGPIDVWTWSKEQAEYPYLESEWSRVGILPFGLPYVEMVMTSNDPPSAVIAPMATFGDIGTVFEFNATGCSDDNTPGPELEVRWDWNDDGIWDVNWTTDKVATHQFTEPGTYTVRLQVRDSQGLTNSTTIQIVVTEVIPEFPTIFVPLVGALIVMAIVIGLRRRRE